MFFMSHFGTNHEQLRTELVSISQIQVNIPQALLLPLLDRALEATQDRQRRLKCTARLSSFNWFLFGILSEDNSVG